ncbi:methyltransferase domain-containing protein [Leptolyngbya sp. 7M]|uniref:methyltransferase domain-containing protein n=1 Tax=Leptolyngbya sp. 7M TaxID=2812896 RepID=UPI001B8B976E|nr:methyltransferase domain-containing protein [Leptolyngbya sp. 7M]QYO66486.1 methyltransferase domain-containing protein [Leptolyngbya sp. 7M]
MFKSRSTEPERIDTGDYSLAEYQLFLREIAFINRFLGDGLALKKTLFREITRGKATEFSLLDVGCGGGELLRITAEFAQRQNIKTRLVGLDLNEIAAEAAKNKLIDVPELTILRGDAFRLPFASNSFDYVISSLFLHHLDDEQIPLAISEMSRIARLGVFVIDLERSRVAYYLYKLFCFAFRISPLVTQDGALSVKKGFRTSEFTSYSPGAVCRRSFPFRLVLSPPAGAFHPSSDE